MLSPSSAVREQAGDGSTLAILLMQRQGPLTLPEKAALRSAVALTATGFVLLSLGRWAL